LFNYNALFLCINEIRLELLKSTITQAKHKPEYRPTFYFCLLPFYLLILPFPRHNLLNKAIKGLIMKIFSMLLLYAALMLPQSSQAQKLSAVQTQKVNELFKSRSVVHFKFTVNSTQEIAALAKVISIDKGQGKTVFAHADKKQFSHFITKNYAYTVVQSPRKIKKVRQPGQQTVVKN
jgi:hypothetical protein